MKKTLKRITFLVLVLCVAFALFNGCATKTAKDFWGDPQTGLKLVYRSMDGQTLTYVTNVTSKETVDMMGQKMTTDSKSNSRFSLQSKGEKEGNLVFGVTIDEMGMEINNPMAGKINPDMKNILGKGFTMSLSPLGKESDFSGTENLKYQMGAAGERKVESSFRSLFPDLAEKPVKVGDTWNTSADINEKSGQFQIKLHFDSVNTLAGLETINDLACIKVTETINGTLAGKGKQMGADLEITGKISGTSTWYFAYKKGYFVKSTVTSTTKGNVVIAAQNMKLPLKSESTMEINLVK